MQQPHTKPASPLKVIVAFATVYIVWGSTYFFIQQALHGFPPLILGAFRFLIAGLLLLGWCAIRGEKIFIASNLRHAAVGGLLVLFIGNGAVIWVEQTIPSAMTAIMVSSSPLWFVILDKPQWSVNFSNRSTIIGIFLGFAGVILLFGERLSHAFSSEGAHAEVAGLVLLMIGVIAWDAGSLYIKYRASGEAATVSTAWQMLFAGIAFIPGVLARNEWKDFQWQQVPASAWWSAWYLVIVGSVIAFSAYIWLLQVRPAAQVSTYAYVNPVVAVALGVLLAGENVTVLQLTGLAIILFSVLLINIAAYRKKTRRRKGLAMTAENSS
jgi:drug/metabolite transporter (DMT)-like permease